MFPEVKNRITELQNCPTSLVPVKKSFFEQHYHKMFYMVAATFILGRGQLFNPDSPDNQLKLQNMTPTEQQQWMDAANRKQWIVGLAGASVSVGAGIWLGVDQKKQLEDYDHAMREYIADFTAYWESLPRDEVIYDENITQYMMDQTLVDASPYSLSKLFFIQCPNESAKDLEKKFKAFMRNAHQP